MPTDDTEAMDLARLERKKLQQEIRAAEQEAKIRRAEISSVQNQAKSQDSGIVKGLGNFAKKFSSADKAREHMAGIKNAVTGPIGYFFAWITSAVGLVVGLTILFIALWIGASYATAGLYKDYGLVCKDSLATSIDLNQMQNKIFQFFPTIFFSNNAFGMCMLNAWFKEMVIDAKWFQNWKFGGFLDDQIMAATGTYYYKEVDENAREPVGVFIEDLTINDEGYPADQDFRIGATIRVKTVGTKIEGSTDCTINEIPPYSRFPNGGMFTSSKSDVLPIMWCDFRKNQHVPGVYPATFKIQSKMIVFGHMLPVVTTRMFYDELSDKNKNQLQTRLEGVGLKTSNTPVQVGSIINEGKENLILIEKNEMLKGYATIPLGFSLDTEGWDDGKVVRFHNLFISLPTGMELEDKNKNYEQEIIEREYADILLENKDGINSILPNEAQDTLIACGGYTFKKISDCSSLSEAMLTTSNSRDNTEFLCDDTSTVYALQTYNSEYKQLGSFDGRKDFLCGVIAPVQDLFTDLDGNPLAFRALPIKIYGTYTFEIKRTATIKVTAGETVENAKLSQYACDQTTVASLKNLQQKIPQSTIDVYTKKYQQKIRTALRSTTQKLPSISEAQSEALLAAMAYKYSGFNVITTSQDNNVATYITGCKSGNGNMIVTPEEDLKCTIAVLRGLLTTSSGNIEDALKQYYSAPERVNLYTASTSASITDYTAWLQVLCKSTEISQVPQNNNINNQQTTITNPQTTTSPKGSIAIDMPCTLHEECVTNLCRPQARNDKTNPTGGNLCIPCTVTPECNPEANDLRKNLICINQQCVVG